MTNGHADQALSLLDAHARSYPNGMLSEERDAQRVLVLCALGRKDDAAKAAGTFVASHPSSPLVGRVQGSCAGQGSK
jgi:RNA polymerase sigma-70 factor (ECF subfamily)